MMKAIMRDKQALKDSGIEWIGDIPVKWKALKITRLFKLIGSGTTPKSTHDEYYNGDVNWLQSGDINGGYVNRTTKKISREICVSNSALTVYKGPFIAIAMYGASIGNIAIVNTDACTNQACCVLSDSINNTNLKYLFYTLKSAKEEMLLSSRGGTQPNISQAIIKQMKITVPSYEEQQLIANYLDDRCSKIDAIIAEAKASIEEYKELKQAVIYEAVTKGVDKNVDMKDSGIEWIGKIPVHWTVKKIKRLGTARNGLTYSPNDMTDETQGTLVIRSSNIQNGKWDYRDNVYVSCEIPDELVLKTGDIVICSRNGSRNLIGKNAIVDSDKVQTFGAFMMVYRSSIENKKYVFWLLNSGVFRYYLPMFFTSTINQLTRNNFNEMIVPFTSSKDEQERIVQYINNKVSIFDFLISEKQSLIEDLEAYKKSLIYEVVTGKRKVVA